MKQKLTTSEDQIVYELGYNDGSSDQFVLMAVTGVVCAIGGGIIGLCL